MGNVSGVDDICERMISLKVPLGMLISELTFYDSMVTLLLERRQMTDISPRAKAHAEEILNNIDAAMRLLTSLRQKLSGIVPKESGRQDEGSKKNTWGS